MEKQKHTPEPWGFDGTQIRGYSDSIIADFSDETCYFDYSDNARRIVACVNACAGIENPEAIPQAIAAMQALVDEHGAARYGTLEKRMRDWTVARDALAALRGK